MLVAMPRDELRTAVAQNVTVTSCMRSTSLATLEHMLKQSLAGGLGINEHNLIPGWNAYAVAVFELHDAPFGPVTVAAEASRMSLAANPDLARVLSTARCTSSVQVARCPG